LAGFDALRGYAYIRSNPGDPIKTLGEYKELVPTERCNELLKLSAWYEKGVHTINPSYLLPFERKPRVILPGQRNTTMRDMVQDLDKIEHGLRRDEERFLANRIMDVPLAINIAGRHGFKQRWTSNQTDQKVLVLWYPAEKDNTPEELKPHAKIEAMMVGNSERLLSGALTDDEQERLRAFVTKLSVLRNAHLARYGNDMKDAEVIRTGYLKVIPVESSSPAESVVRTPRKRLRSPIKLAPHPRYATGFAGSAKVLGRGHVPLPLPDGVTLGCLDYDRPLPLRKETTEHGVCPRCGASGDMREYVDGNDTYVWSTTPENPRTFDQGLNIFTPSRKYYIKGGGCGYGRKPGKSYCIRYDHADVLSNVDAHTHISIVRAWLWRYWQLLEASCGYDETLIKRLTGEWSFGTQATWRHFTAILNNEAAERKAIGGCKGGNQAISPLVFEFQFLDFATVLHRGAMMLLPKGVRSPVPSKKAV
jgi:hypothetical protein